MASRTRRTTRTVNPDNAATDPRAAAQQRQIKKDHDVLVASAKRTAATASGDQRGASARRSNRNGAATDPRGAAIQKQVKRDRDSLAATARRIDSTAAVVEDPEAARKSDRAHKNAEAARKSARRVQRSTRSR
jgi:hypothetical protein